jgi:hexosaminidase
VRHLELLARKVAAASAGPADVATLRAVFSVWAANDPHFQAMAEGNALLAEVKSLSKDLSAVGAMGIEILDYWSGAKPAPSEWIAAQTKEITRMQRPNAEVLLAATRPVKILLDGLAKR